MNKLPNNKLHYSKVQPDWFKTSHERLRLSIQQSQLYQHQLILPEARSLTRIHQLTVSNLMRCTDQSYGKLMKESKRDDTLIKSVGNRFFITLNPYWNKWTTRAIFMHASDIANLHRFREPKALCLQSACLAWDVPVLSPQPQTSILVERASISHRKRMPSQSPFPRNISKPFIYNFDSSDITVLDDGLAVTTEVRTLFDVLSRFPAPDYVVPADALLRRLSGYNKDRRTVHKHYVEAVHQQLIELLNRQSKAFPKKRVLERFAMLIPQVDSPAESLVHFRLRYLGITELQSQHPLVCEGTDLSDARPLNDDELAHWDPSSDGPTKTWFIDFLLKQQGVAIEVDGAGKRLAEFTTATAATEQELRRVQQREHDRTSLIKRKYPTLINVSWPDIWKWEKFYYMFKNYIPA